MAFSDTAFDIGAFDTGAFLLAEYVPPPPILTNPIGAGGTGLVDSDSNSGTIWCYVSMNSQPPSVADHKSGAGADEHQSESFPRIGTNVFNLVTLERNVLYYAHFLHNNSQGDSNQATSGAFVLAPLSESKRRTSSTVRGFIVDVEIIA